MLFEEKRVQQELDKLGQHGIFLDKDFDSEGQYIYYSVKHSRPDTAPVVLVDWRYDLGGTKYPKPLSLDLVAAVRAQEGSMKEAFDKALVDNAVKKELAKQAAERETEDLIKEHDIRHRKQARIYGPWKPGLTERK